MSLRQVEEASGKEVSNAYLSQLENGKILQPSPIILNKLAEIYGIEYTTLMQLAGYLPAAASRAEGERHGRIATFAEHNLSPDEEGQLMEYLQFIRSKKRSQ
jgi:transcriptional regulator with XRE-family HTH domain